MPTTRKQIAPSISRQSEVRLSVIAPKDIDRIWFLAEPCIARAYLRVDQDVPLNLRDSLCDGKRELWLVTEDDVTILAVIVTSMVTMRSGLVLRIESLGGVSMQRWVHFMVSELEAYARSQNCKKLAWEGRVGWKRLFPDYRVSSVVMEKRLDRDAVILQQQPTDVDTKSKLDDSR